MGERAACVPPHPSASCPALSLSLPCCPALLYRLDVPQVKITVFEGERAKVEDNSPLGTFDLTGWRLCLLCPLRLPRCLLLCLLCLVSAAPALLCLLLDLPAHSTQ